MPVDISKLIESKEIVFGPFVGELGWEIIRWSGFIRWFKKKYPDKKIIISTRENRQDLYTGSANELQLFNLEGDYLDFIPNCYDNVNLPELMYSQIIHDLKNKYPDAFYFEPRAYKCEKDLFDFTNMDFNYTPKTANKSIISSIIEKKGNRIPILIASRDRKETTKRNWGSARWKLLFNVIQNSNKFLVFVAGISPSYFKAEASRPYFFNLEDYIKPELETSAIGLTIEAIKASDLTIGSQTATIVLSNLLGKQTLFWGDQIKRHAVFENPFGTKSIGIEDYTYCVDPMIIFKHIKSMIKYH